MQTRKGCKEDKILFSSILALWEFLIRHFYAKLFLSSWITQRIYYKNLQMLLSSGFSTITRLCKVFHRAYEAIPLSKCCSTCLRPRGEVDSIFQNHFKQSLLDFLSFANLFNNFQQCFLLKKLPNLLKLDKFVKYSSLSLHKLTSHKAFDYFQM